ncbi:hypothetical protein MtrunA17_Chr8g0371461 [Medicago truncatula]|uniref:Uncharacterized protein n=1 Tax=Medicago truncatula TaxID=3880 RepID=A0A072TU96_MEDTR|nr:hypothetical protein MTR_8g075195 [Medicago truncatula]RHN41943.1 hypothetical protein MtrunA17_Chr8g0371461 [Medicago truncatula]
MLYWKRMKADITKHGATCAQPLPKEELPSYLLLVFCSLSQSLSKYGMTFPWIVFIGSLPKFETDTYLYGRYSFSFLLFQSCQAPQVSIFHSFQIEITFSPVNLGLLFKYSTVKTNIKFIFPS